MKIDDQKRSQDDVIQSPIANVTRSMRQLLSSSRVSPVRDIEETKNKTIFRSLPEDRDICDIGGITEAVYIGPPVQERDPFKAAILECLKREELTIRELDICLKKERWSFLEAAHIICNKKLPETEQNQRTLPKDVFGICLKILKAIEDKSLSQTAIIRHIKYKPLAKGPLAQAHELEFRKGESNLRGIDQQDQIYNLGDFESEKLYWDILPEIFVIWALDNYLILSLPLLDLLNLFPPMDLRPCHKFKNLGELTDAGCQCLHFLHSRGFDGYKKLDQLNSFKKSDRRHIRLQIAAQILWYKQPDLTHLELIQLNHFKKIAEEEGLYTVETKALRQEPTKPMRKILQSIKPRVVSAKKGLSKRHTTPHPPKTIEGIILTDSHNKPIIHFQKLRMIAETFGQQMRQLYPKRNEDSLLKHPIIHSYLSRMHPFVFRMVCQWLLNSTRRIPYDSESYIGKNSPLRKMTNKISMVLKRTNISPLFLKSKRASSLWAKSPKLAPI